MSGQDCINDEPHLWIGVGHAWECKNCGKPGVDCEACGGTGWAVPPAGETCDSDCEACKGAGVVPAKEASDERAL